ncbi:tetratricopeptide repeat protein [Dactylosporangium sp. NPDC000555]|uniref:tetratricopeptide repeat protein n=1 Tax=Dactylosporangium sp. NPDC000555 TaxID=3154260 RepID=UPI00331DBB42
MAPAAAAGGSEDPLASLLDPQVAEALREWAMAGGGVVQAPSPGWSASGYTGAVVAVILFEERRPDGAWSSDKQIIKVIPAGEERETGLHEEAWRHNQSFAKRHLVRQRGRPWPVGDGRYIMFQDIAGDLLDYCPVDRLDGDVQAVCCAAVARLVLTDWNGNRWPDRPTRTRKLVGDYLRHELRKRIDKIEQWAEQQGLARPGEQWVGAPTADDGERLPNPIAMVRTGLSAQRVIVQYLWGLSHGDLHRGNILVPVPEPAPGDPPAPLEVDQIRIVDLAAFDPAAPLTRDLVELSLSFAAAELEGPARPDAAEVLLRVLLDGTGRPGPAASPTGDALRSIHRGAGQPRSFLIEWRTQYLLSLLAGALRHTGYKNHDDATRRWFFRVAARSTAEFLRFAEQRQLIPVEPAAEEAPEHVVVSLVSAVSDRPAAYTLQKQLERHAEAGGLSWTVHVLLHTEERGAAPDAGPRSPDVVVYLLSERSVVDHGCRRELDAAKAGGFPVIAVRTDATTMRLGDRQDVVQAGPDGFAELTRRVAELSLTEQVRRQIAEKLAQTEAEAERAAGPRRRRLDAYNSEKRVRLEDERRRTAGAGPRRDEPVPSDLTAVTVSAHHVRLVNEAPAVAEGEFCDRVAAMHGVEDTIGDASTRVVLVYGASGAGKTAFTAELRRRLAAPRPRAAVDAVVYLSADGYRPVNVATVLLDLVRSLPEGADRERLTARLTDPIEWREKLTDVLAGLDGRSVVVVLDAAEHLFDAAGTLRDRDLGALVRELAGRPGHSVTLVLTVADGPPRQIRRDLSANVRFVAIERGLPFADTIRFLTALDRTATLGLSALAQDDDFRQRVYEVSRGHPRTLELLVGLLRLDPDRSVVGLLDDLERMAPENVAPTLFDWTFAQLDRTEQRALQALAAYRRPVPPAAVDFLLKPFVKGIDSAPVLRGLHERRIVRHDHGHYFLPAAESAQVLDGIPQGALDDHGHVPPVLTRFALLYRAAVYFEQAQPAQVTGLLDLRPYFSEIDLRIRAWDFHRAYEVMNHIEDEYLRPWGQSDVLLDWRRAVRGRVGDDAEEANNRRRLVAALQQQEDIDGALTELTQARRECSWLRAPRARLALDIQLANVHFDAGRLSRAGRLYRRQLWQSRLVGGTGSESTVAQGNLALCLGRIGHHARALRMFAAARSAARRLSDTDRNRILPELLASHAWVLGQLDETPAAMERLREGRSVAAAAGNRNQVGLGLCLNGEAAILVDSGAAEAAGELAQKAAEIGVLTRDPNLIRQANLNLGLAYLCLDRDADALATAEISARLDRGPHAIGANGLLGIAAFRCGRPDRARLAFLTAMDAAGRQLEREQHDYVAWDARGLACFGLALIEVEQQSKRLAQAAEAFARARRITSAAGAVRRNAILLGRFGERADDGLVAAMTAVARGAGPPFGTAY